MGPYELKSWIPLNGIKSLCLRLNRGCKIPIWCQFGNGESLKCWRKFYLWWFTEISSQRWFWNYSIVMLLTISVSRKMKILRIKFSALIPRTFREENFPFHSANFWSIFRSANFPRKTENGKRNSAENGKLCPSLYSSDLHNIHLVIEFRVLMKSPLFSGGSVRFKNWILSL